MRRSARLTSETKPACLKAATWALIQGAHARRAALLAGRGNTGKARAMARYFWSIKDEISSELRVAGPRGTGATTPCPAETLAKPKRIRLGNPLRNVPEPFTRKSFG